MKPEKVFKRYDIRGTYPEEIDEKFAYQLGKSLGTFIRAKNSNNIVVGRDNKESSKELKPSLIDGLNEVGVNVLDAGIGPTDYTSFSGKKEKTFSIQITSSHMPQNFNGFKLMYPEGNSFLNNDQKSVKEIFRSEDFLNTEKKGTTENISDKLQKKYKSEIINYVESTFDVEKKKVVIDTLGGATKHTLKPILEELGHEVIDIEKLKGYNSYPYRDPPNPSPEQLKELEETVKQSGADLGLAADMDGDRATLYYQNRFLDGNELFGVFSQIIEGDIVGSIDTSKTVEKQVKQDSSEIFYTRVGDPFVLDKAVLEENVKLAGEPNGHYAFLDFLPYSSGTLALAISSSIDLNNYLSNLSKLYRARESFEVENKSEKIKEIEKLAENNYEIISRIDGVKFKAENEVSVLIRSSGSSPKIRVIAEGKDEEIVDNVMNSVSDWAK